MESSWTEYSSEGANDYIIDLKNKENKLGFGSFADVFKIYRKSDNKPFAGKIIKIEYEYLLPFQKIGPERELKILKSINHPLVIKHVDEFLLDEKLCIVSSLASDKDFEKVI